MNKRRTVRRLIPYFILILALASGILAVRPALDFLSNQLHALQVSLVEALERATGLKVRYSHVSPSILLRADINDVRLERQDGSVFFTARQIRISYSILDFLSGSGLGAVKAVETVGSELRFDLEKDKKLFFPDGTDGAKTTVMDIPAQVREVLDQVSRYLPSGIRFDFLDTRVLVSGKGTRLDFQLGQAGLVASPEKLDLEMTIRLEQAISDSLDFLGGLSGEIRFEGQYFRKNRQLQTQVAARTLTTKWGTLAPQKLSLLIDAEEIRLNRIVDQEPVDLQIRWKLPTNSIELSLQSEAWQIGSQVKPAQSLGEWESLLLSGRYTADIAGTYQLGDGGFDYRAVVHGVSSRSVSDDVRLDLDIRGSRDRLPDGYFDLELPGAAISFRTDRASSGRQLSGDIQLAIGQPWLPVSCDINGPLELTLRKSGFHAAMATARGSLGDNPLMAAGIDLGYADGGLDFLLDCWSDIDSSGGGEDGKVSLKGRFESGRLLLSSDFNRVHLTRLGGLIRPIALLAAASDPGEIDLSGLPDDLEADGSLELVTKPELHLQLHELRVRTAVLDQEGPARTIFSGNMDFDGQNLTFNQGEVELPWFKLGLDANLVFGSEGTLNARIEADAGTFGIWKFAVYRAPDGQFSLQGPYGLFVSGQERLSSGDGMNASVSFQGYPLPVLGERATVSGALSAVVGRDGTWKVQAQSLDFVSLAINPVIPQKLGRLTLRDSQISMDGVQLGDVRYQDSQSSLTGNGRIAWKAERLPECQWDLDLQGSPSLQSPIVNPKAEILGLHGSYLDGQVRLSASWTDAPIGRFIEETFKGFYSVETEMAFRPDALLDSLELKGKLATPRAYLNKDAINIQTGFSFHDRQLELSAFSIGLLEHRLEMSAMQADLASGKLDLSARYRNNNVPEALPVQLRGSCRWNAASPSLIAAVFDGLEANLGMKDVPGVDNRVHDYDFVVSSSAGTLLFNETGSQALRGRYRQDGNFQFSLQKPFPVSASIAGSLKGGQIEATATNIGLELSSFGSLLDLGIFKLSSGSLSGALRMVGDINDPDFYGSLRGNDLKARVSFVPEELTATRGVLVFEEKKVRLLSLNAKAGDSQAVVDGDFTLNRMNIESVTVRIDVPPEGKGVHVKGDLPMVNVDGLAHGKLSVAWSGNTMRFSGQIRADETSLQLLQFVRQEAKVAPAFSASPQPESDPFYYEVALGFTSGKSVEFFWPNRSIPILRTYLDLDQTLRIVYDSLSGTWSLNGNLKARGGELVFLKRNFLIREAALLFAENQDKFDPRITGRAETRMSYGDKPVKVSLVLENNTLGNLTPRISTDTPLSGEQLNSILIGDTLNIANEETKGAQDLYNLASSAVAMVSQIGVLDPLMSKVLDPVRLALGLDLLTVRSNILSTMAVDSFFNLGGYNPLDNQSSIIGKYLDNTTLQAGKFFGNDLYGEVLGRFRSVSTTSLNTGAPPKDLGSILKAASGITGVGFELDLSMDWDIPPFFNIGWSSSLKDLSSADAWLKSNAFAFSLHLP